MGISIPQSGKIGVLCERMLLIELVIKLQLQSTRKLEQFLEPLQPTMHFEVWLCQQRAGFVQVLEAVGIPETIREIVDDHVFTE